MRNGEFTLLPEKQSEYADALTQARTLSVSDNISAFDDPFSYLVHFRKIGGENTTAEFLLG
jgi:hypothetical protein